MHLTCVDQTHPMPGRTQNVSEHAFTKSTLGQWGHKMQLNMCWPNLSHASDKMYLNMCWTNITYANEEDIKCISTSTDQTLLISAKTQNVSQYFWPKTSHANEDTKCISTWLEQSPPMPARTQNASTFVDRTNSIPAKTKMYLYSCWLNLSHTSKENKCTKT